MRCFSRNPTSAQDDVKIQECLNDLERSQAARSFVWCHSQRRKAPNERARERLGFRAQEQRAASSSFCFPPILSEAAQQELRNSVATSSLFWSQLDEAFVEEKSKSLEELT
ncbi:unnamed protein product [Sphagnum jensenii]|uniref:Uncharacterized protein n=1 Tax=Sphagnum jensenii TaxID=128206 RepID=A0ABP0XI46_9BRYO